jgi:hypothetical protein
VLVDREAIVRFYTELARDQYSATRIESLEPFVLRSLILNEQLPEMFISDAGKFAEGVGGQLVPATPEVCLVTCAMLDLDGYVCAPSIARRTAILDDAVGSLDALKHDAAQAVTDYTSMLVWVELGPASTAPVLLTSASFPSCPMRRSYPIERLVAFRRTAGFPLN